MNHQRLIFTLVAILFICSKLFSFEKTDSEITKNAIADGMFACSSLLSNSGFESDLAGWSTTINGVSISSDATEGNKAVLLNNTGTGIGLWQGVNGSANEIYTLTVVAKKTAEVESSISIAFYDTSGTKLDSKFQQITSSNYQEYSLSAMTPDNVAEVRVTCWSGNGTGTTFFDDICLDKFTVDPISCSPSVDISPSDRSVYVMDHSGNSSDTKNYDYGDIKLCDNGDGTLSVKGYVIGGHDADWHPSDAVPCGVQDAWYIDLLLSDVQTWEEFQGLYVQQEGCTANKVDWDFWKISGSYIGIGCNTGRTINVISASVGYRLQVGWGGNSQSCDFGMSTWFVGDENGTTTHSDMYFHIKETDYEMVRPPKRKNPSCVDNLLRNPSFEDIPTNSPPYWTVPTASTFTTTNNYTVSGSLSSNLNHNGSGIGQVYQQVTGIIPGNNYNLSFYGGTHQPNYSHTVKIEFYDSSNTLLETSEVVEVDKDVDGNNLLDPYNLTSIAPPNTSYLRVVGTAESDNLRLDEVCLTTDKNICDNSISNTEFNNGITDWTFKTIGEARGRALLDIDNTNQLSGPISSLITIDNSSHEVSDIQLLHDDLSILSGEEYQINFQAKATTNRPITVAIQKTSSPHTVYKSQTFDLTTNQETYSFSYTPNIDNLGDAELVFQLGGNRHEVYLDKVEFSVICDGEICNNGIDDDGDGFIDQFDPGCVCTANGLPNIDFSKDINGNPLVAGTLVGETWAAWGIHITTDAPSQRPAMIFDSNNPTEDPDLGTPNSTFGGPGIGEGGEIGEIGENKIPLGNVLIIPNSPTEINDYRPGGDLIFTFDTPANLDALEIIDFDTDAFGIVTAYDINNNIIVQKQIQDYGDNSYQKLSLNAVNISRLVITAHTSFSVATMLFCDPIETEIEDCYNGIDDDGDGLIDNADSDCTSICTSPTLIFQNPRLVSGAADAVGAVYKFSDVLTGIDAKIELIDKSHSEIKILNMDLLASVTGGYDYAFQPQIDYNWLNEDGSYDPFGQRWVEFELTFYESGTNNVIDIPLATISAIDIDGNGDGLKEFFETQNFDAYRLQSNTNLTTSGSLKATGSYVNQNGIDETALETMVSFDFNNVNTIKFKYGAHFDFSTIHREGEERLNCLFFKCYDFDVTEYCPNITIIGDPSICPNGSTELTTEVVNTEGTCYLQWESSTDNTNWDVMPGATSNTFSITNLSTPTYYRVAIYCDDIPLCGVKYSQRHFVDIQSCAEICDNGIDDDGDGLTDCDDDDCPTPSIGDVQFTEPTNCPDLDNGTITITASSANDLEYSIDHGNTFQSSGNFTNLVAAVYNVVIRDKESQCEVTYNNNPVILLFPDCAEICDNNIDDDGDGKVDCNDGDCGKPVIDSVTPSNPNNCPALDNGTIAILASGDNLEYSIDNGANFQSSPNFENLSAGTYTINVRNTVTDCQETATTTLRNTSCTENCTDGIDNNGDGQIDCEDDACGKPTIIDVTVMAPDNCPLATNGTITIIASGANLVYSINGGNTFQNARIFTDLSPGSFNIVVKNNSTGCTASYPAAVVVPDPPCGEICDNGIDDDGDGLTDCEDGDCGNPTISDVVGSDPNNCPILDNGEITITATGPNLEYSIDGGVSYYSGNKFINLIAGTYHIQVKNSVTGCTTTYDNNPVILTDPECEEECGNGIDDDGDGEIDLQDDDCDGEWPQVYVPNSRWLCEGTDYVFEVPVPFPNFTYFWDFGIYASQGSATGPGPHTIQFTPPTGTAAVYPRVLFTATTTTYSVRDTFDLQIRPTISIANALPITPSDCGATDGSVVIEVNRQADACFELSLDGGTTWELENQTYFDNLSTGSYSIVARYCDESCVSEPSIVTLADPTITTILGNDEFGDICPNQTYTNTVISNDIVKNLNVIYSIVTPTTHGTIVMDTKGSFEYTTTETYCGMDQFSYSVCDPENICCVTAVATLDLGDKQDPILQNVPADITVSCDEEIPLPALITAYDNCPSISIDKDEVNTQGLDGCSLHDYTITRSWTATDLCNNTKTEEQVITIADITAPDIFRIYTLPNGKKLVAGVMENVYQEWKTIPFPIQFNQTPLVFTQVVTTEDITPVVTRIRNTSTTQFELKLQEEENGDQSHARESVAWIAIEPGAQTEDYLLETGTIDIKENWKTINFSNSYADVPNFFTSLQSFNEIDPSVVRTQNLGTTGVTCKLLEETSGDPEKVHELESMAYLAIGMTGNITDEKGHIIGEVGKVSIDHNRVKITTRNNYYNPVIITQSLTNNGSDPITQRIDLTHQASFDIQLQEWEYQDGPHTSEEVSYLIIEGSIPLDASIICSEGTDGLEMGKDIVAVDNCDPNTVLQYEEGKALSGASKQTIRTWYAEDICGNKTAYSQVINCQGMSLQLKALLQGALVNNNNEAIMRDDLRRLDLLPLEEPYSDFKEYTHVGQGGGEIVDPSLFQQTGDKAIVDWVFIELMNADNFEEVIATKSALIQRDGNVVNVDGNPIISFFDVPNGEYYVKLRHRNHLPLETLYPYTFTPSNIPFIDFTDEFLPLRGNTTRVVVNDQLAAWSGDLNGDNLTVFQGPNNDIFQMFLEILLDELNQNTLSNFISAGYTNRDFNMDGTVIFQGPNNDRSVLLWNTIFNHPDNELNQSNFIVSIAEIVQDLDIESCLLDKTQIFCDFDGDGILNGSDPDDDNDGVSDGNDIAPYNNQSDTDKDGISDNDETGNDGSYHRGTDTDPLSACDPFQDNNICNGADIDGDGFFSNYPLAHSKYDPNDQNSCEPNGTAAGCSCPDDNGDGFILICDKNNDTEGGRTIQIRVGDWQANQALGNECGPCLDETNTPSLPVFDEDKDGYFIGAQPVDTDDNNPCLPNTNSFACQQIDRDLDGSFGNADPSSPNYDLDDNNACIPVPTIFCYGIDHDGDGHFGNFPQGHALADPDDNDSCVPDVAKCPVDQDGDGYFDNISPLDKLFDPNDADDCIPDNAACGGCPTFQGVTFICNNPGTSNEATVVLEPSENLADYSNSYCGPCVQFSTVADGEWEDAATWKNGKIPPTNMNSINVSINHALTVSKEVTIGFGGYLWIKGEKLEIKNASLNLTGGVLTAVNAQIVVDKTVSIDQVSSKFYIKNSTLLIKENYLITNSGVSYFEGACVTVKGNYNVTHGIEVYENTKLTVEQGNLSVGQNSTIVIKFSKMQIAGNFDNKGLLTGMETLPALTALSVNGNLSNTGLWLCGIENQYCIRGTNEIPEIYLKGVENCSGINDFFDDHECP